MHWDLNSGELARPCLPGHVLTTECNKEKKRDETHFKGVKLEQRRKSVKRKWVDGSAKIWSCSESEQHDKSDAKN